MKNLYLYFAASTNGSEVESRLRDALCFSTDSLNSQIYFALRDSIIALNSHMKLVNEINWSNHWDPNVEVPVLFDFLFDEGQLCAVFNSGRILSIDPATKEIHEAACFPFPVSGGRWSPDLQILVLASSEMLFLLSREFEIISEESINPTAPGKDQLLTVGWGSRESQFHGAGTRTKREAVDVDRTPSNLWPHDDRSVFISWRADAQFFTVSSVVCCEKSDGTSTESRVLRVWNRELELNSQCDWLHGIENVLSMRPQGNLIATTRVFAGERFLWLFERNGQYRSKFSMGLCKDRVVRKVEWNIDSSVLMVLLDNLDVTELEFWTVSNYEWALKLVVKPGSKVANGLWDSENPHCFHFYTTSGHYRRICMEKVYNVYEMLVVNVNKDKLRITDLSKAPIPPPMCHYEVELPTTVLTLIQSSKSLAVLLSDLSLVVYDLTERKYVYKDTINLTSINGYNSVYNLQWVDENRLSVICKSKNYEIVEISLSNKSIKTAFSHETPLIWHTYADDDLGYIIQLTNGDFLSAKPSNITLPLELYGKQIKLNSFNCFKCWFIHDKKLIISLNKNNQLLVNGESIHSSISSVSISDEFILVTTLSNTLHCLPTNELASLQSKNFDNFEGRAIERGAEIVTHEPRGTRVWLQMPRGNLETIHHRALLIDKLKNLLNGLEFGKAIKEMRKHRVDMNFLYDFNPRLLLDNVKAFVDQIDDAELLNLFISGVYDEDSMAGIFAPYSSNRTLDQKLNDEKVNRICQALLEYLLSLDWDRLKTLYTCVLSCFVKTKPSRISEALSDLKTRQSYANGEGDLLLREWLRHLSYLADDKLLFNKALKTYDLHIALLVAEACDRDPKEYLPLLRDLQKISPPYFQRYHIDLKLDPPDVVSALENIAEVEEKFMECIQHIQNYKLYSQALVVFKNKSQYKEICRIYAEYLFKSKRFEESSLLFRKIEDWENVLKCYELCKNYVGYIEVSSIVNTPDDVRRKALEKMALSFEANNNFVQAAEIFEGIDAKKYMSRIVENLCRALSWSHALRITIMTNSGREQLADLVYKRFDGLLSLISHERTEIDKLVKRLDEVRENKMRQLNAWIETEGELDVDMSETSSTISNLSKISKFSTVSTRRRKNIEKKKKHLKEGSAYEDAAILSALKEIYASMMMRQEELKELLPVMVNMDLIDEARDLQKKMLSLLTFATQSMKRAWPSYIQLRVLLGPIYEIYREEDGIIRIPTENVMPSRIPLDNELVPPAFSVDPSWQMEILK